MSDTPTLPGSVLAFFWDVEDGVQVLPFPIEPGESCEVLLQAWRAVAKRYQVRARDLNCVMFDPPTRPEEVTAWVQGGELLMGHPNATTLFTFGDLERM